MKRWLANKLLTLLRINSPSIAYMYGIDGNGKKILNRYQVEKEEKAANKIYKEIKANRL